MSSATESLSQDVDRTQARILIVDDQETNRAILARRLQMDHFHAITQAADGREALDLLEREPFDIVLLDMKMPEVDGYEVLTTVKNDPDLKDIPIIMISAEDDITKIVQCIQAGAEDYLGKPFNPTLLRARFNASLDKKFLRDKEKQYQKQILSQQKMASLGALTEGIAHELKNPLHFVTNFGEVSVELAQELASHIAEFGEKYKIPLESFILETLKNLETTVEKIVEHGKRADSIIRFMLDHSRTSGGKLQEGNLNKLLEECATMALAAHKSRYALSNALIEKSLDPQLPKIPIIWQDLARVIMNIIDNALYAAHTKASTQESSAGSSSSEGGALSVGGNAAPTIHISSRDLGKRVEICVRDSGFGIAKENIEKIFDPFFTTKPSGNGAGLGLSRAKDVIQAHEGELSVDSCENEWTTFTITLPKAMSPA